MKKEAKKLDTHEIEEVIHDMKSLSILVGSLSKIQDLNSTAFEEVTYFLEKELIKRIELIEQH